jgi:hypothetical protein
MEVRLSALSAARALPFTFVEIPGNPESTPEPYCGKKDWVNLYGSILRTHFPIVQILRMRTYCYLGKWLGTFPITIDCDLHSQLKTTFTWKVNVEPKVRISYISIIAELFNGHRDQARSIPLWDNVNYLCLSSEQSLQHLSSTFSTHYAL